MAVLWVLGRGLSALVDSVRTHKGSTPSAEQGSSVSRAEPAGEEGEVSFLVSGGRAGWREPRGPGRRRSERTV